MRSGRDVLFEVLADEGVRHLFGNPGTTELPLMDELVARPEFTYVLALQENTAVGMADGYAQATRRPAFVNLHTSAGLGGGVGNLTNALANRTPLVVTAGQQDRRHLIGDPLLSGDLTGLARPVSKWQHEVRHAAELGTVLRRAFKDAATPPTGPVFVSLPMDILDETGDVAVPARSQLALDSVGGSLDELADLLASSAPEGLALIAGDEIAIAGALDEMVALADALGARVYGAPLHSKTVFPPRHPLWSGALVPAAAALSGALSAFSRVFVVGAPAMLVYPYTPGPAVPESVELLHLSADPAQPGRTHAVRLGVTGGIRATLAALSPLVRDRVDAERVTAARDRAATDRPASIESFDAMARDRYSAAPMNPMAAVHALLAAAPPNTVVVDEAVTTGGYVRGFQLEGSPGSYYFCAGGGLGWGMPAALGVQLAEPERRVIAIVGDGSAMYAVQSLWTAAHYRLPVLFAIVNNRQYAILKGNLMGMGGRSAAAGEFVGMDIDDPPIDYVALARGMGVDGALVEKAADVTDAARAALASGKPWLLELPIAAR